MAKQFIFEKKKYKAFSVEFFFYVLTFQNILNKKKYFVFDNISYKKWLKTIRKNKILLDEENSK